VEIVRKLAVDGLSANPPGRHHRLIAERLAEDFDEVIIVPCGPRPEKVTTNDIPPIHRAVMADLTFEGIPNVTVDLDDLEREVFTRSHVLLERYKDRGEVWLVVGADLVIGGRNGSSVIQREWEKGQALWLNARFVVITRPGFVLQEDDYPPHHVKYECALAGSSTQIREHAFAHKSLEPLVLPSVAAYIERHKLYRGMSPKLATEGEAIPNPHILLKVDRANPLAVTLGARFSSLEGIEAPNCIVAVGGDGFMLQTIREYWRLRLPILGINAGHRGFLLNDVAEDMAAATLFQNLHIIQSPLLYVQATSASGNSSSHLAFNDAWFHASNGGQAAWLEVSVDGIVRISKLVGDGALIATSGGSTSYARALGVKPMPVGTDQLILAGINVFEPYGWGPVHLRPNQNVSLRCLDSGKRSVTAYVDGVELEQTSLLFIRQSRVAAAELAFLPNNDPQAKILRLQFPLEH
jgi:NAD kinase